MSEPPSLTSQPSLALAPPSRHPTLRKWAKEVWIHITRHVGIGIICSVAYFDPGNWGVDLQAGSDFGYKLLFVVLLSGICAVVVQSLSCKLGVVTGLGQLILLLTVDSSYTIEIGIISTDLAELLGSAIALNLLFPKLPLWAGVLLTAFDVLLILAFADPIRGRPVRSFELLIGILVLIVLVCMCILVARIEVDWDAAFNGFLPSKTLFQHGGLYTSVGILGATVMPHSLFLGSALATQDRAFVNPVSLPGMSIVRATGPTGLLGKFLRLFRPVHGETSDEFASHADRPNNSLQFIKAHLHHAVADIVVNLLGVAVVINSLILILAATVFHQPGVDDTSADIFDAHSLLSDIVGRGAAAIFALALLCAGQSASLVATVAGQIVSEGFLRWRISPFARRLITRLLGLIPSMAVAVAVGRPGVNAMLIGSQVVLSIVLPFIIFPLVWLTSSRTVMRVRAPVPAQPAQEDGPEDEKSVAEGEYLYFNNGWVLAGFGYLIWVVIVIANGYVLITLALGDAS